MDGHEPGVGGRRGGWWTGVAVGAACVPILIPLDAALDAALRAWCPAWLVWLLAWATWLGYGGLDIGLPAALALLGWARREPGEPGRGLRAAAVVAAAGLAGLAIKSLACRARPSAAAAGRFLTEFPCAPAPYGLASFPSGHAVTGFALATLLSLWYPRATPVFLGLAAAVGASRVVLGAHFPSDVLAGALLGTAAALAAHARWPELRRPERVDTKEWSV